MERKLHTHKHTPTRSSKRDCLASASFQSMNTPPPPVNRARQKKVEASRREREKFFSQLERKCAVDWLAGGVWRGRAALRTCVRGEEGGPQNWSDEPG